MHLLQFGSSRKRLFGVYHAAEGGRGPRAGVVFCQPHGHEYIRAHRALRMLAARLSGAGVHVLRFDYYGTGDSEGEGHEASLPQWRTDVASAIDELKDMADLQRVSLLGVRLGGLLSALTASDRKDVDALVLWDPVVRGTEYVDAVRDLQSRWLASRPWMTAQSSEQRELIGFPLTEALESELRAADALQLARWPRRVAVATSRNIDAGALVSHLTSVHVPLAANQVDCDCEWTRAGAVHLTLLASEMSQQLGRYVTGKDA